MSTPHLQPWSAAGVVPHEDIQRGELAMDTYAADLAAVVRQDPQCPRVYREPLPFFQATYLTVALRALLRDTLHVLAGGAGDRVLQLRTPFGGGKTHSLVALYHLTTGRRDLAGMSEIAALPDPGSVLVPVLAGIELDASVGRQVGASPLLRTLWGDLAWQLGGSVGYDLVREQDQARTSPGGEVVRRLLRMSGKPTLLLLDEVLVYVEKALTIQVLDSTYGRQVMVFLQTLTEVVRGLPHAAMVYSLQASAGEAFGNEGALADLDKLVSRVDAKREPVSGDEVLSVVQRRLFANLGPDTTRYAVARAYAELQRRFREHAAGTDAERREAVAEAELLEQRIVASYPFHPALLDLMYHRWGSLPSYQRTRGALQFLAQVVHAQWHGPQHRQVQALIGPGDVPLEHEGVRGALFSQVGERETYTSVLASDLTGANPRAGEVDARLAAESPALSQIKVGTRLASAALLYSFGAREGEDRGIGEGDLIAAALAPGLDRMVLVTTLTDLRESLLYLHYTGRRYRFETQANLNKLIADEARRFTGDEALERIKHELTRQLGAPAGTPIWPIDGQAIADREPVFRVVYLPLDWAERTREAAEQGIIGLVDRRGNGKREYRNALAFAVPGHQPADRAREAARQVMALDSLLSQRARFAFPAERLDELKERRDSANADLDGALRRLYEQVYLPVTAQEANGGAMPIALHVVDLRAELATSPQVHGRVLNALRTQVFTTLTPERIVTLTRLGQPPAAGQDAGPLALPAEQVVAYFYSFLGFPRLTDARVLRNAIAQGIEVGRFGYVAGVGATDAKGVPVLADGKYVRYNDTVRADDLTLEAGAYLLASDLAAELRRIGVPQPPTMGYEGTRPTPAAIGNGGASYTPTPMEPPAPAPSPVAPDGRPHRFRLRLSAPAARVVVAWTTLSHLFDMADRTDITLDVVATSAAGFDQVRVRNMIVEPLEEAGNTVETHAEE